LLSIDFTPQEDARQYASSNPQAVIGWCQALRDTAEYGWVKNPAAFVRSRIDQNLTPPFPNGQADQAASGEGPDSQADQAAMRGDRAD
jgi:hypothetical protein